MSYTWSDDRISLLLVLWRGGSSAREIGITLGTSRYSVIGKLWRLGESRPGTQSQNGALGGKLNKKPRSARYNYRFEKTPPELKHPGTFPPELPVLDASSPVIFADLKSYHCRWPIGDPRTPEFRFCGAPAAPYCPYCAHHYEASIKRSDGDDKD